LDEVEIAAHFERVLAAHEADVVGKFEAALDAVDRGIGLAAKISEARNIDAYLIATGKLRETEMQTAAGALEAKFVEPRIAQDGVVLKNDGEIAGLVEAGARAGVLTEDLVLRSGFNPSDE